MQVRRWGAAAALAWAIALAAVSIGATPVAAATATASATLVDAAGHQVGWAKFHEDGRGRVHVNVHVEGLSVGAHGIHIHTVGSCAHTAMAFGGAGGHFNPTNAPHPRHAGDLGNLHAKRNGKAHLNAKSAGFTCARA
jgi:Cu-Zn family superoxide dismutase